MSNAERAMLIGARPSMTMGHLMPELGIEIAVERVAQPAAIAALRSLRLAITTVVKINAGEPLF